MIPRVTSSSAMPAANRVAAGARAHVETPAVDGAPVRHRCGVRGRRGGRCVQHRRGRGAEAGERLSVHVRLLLKTAYLHW